MANGQDLVPEGAIGATIDDEQPSKAKQFFTDPQNLATMLVLASALAQPRRGGRTPLAHTLRAGTGALAFRGGLGQSIEASEQVASEAASVVQAREEQARLSEERNVIAGEQVEATERGQDIRATESAADRASREAIEAARIGRLPTPQEQLENELLKIGVEGFYKAYSDYLLSGSPGSPPDPKAMIALPDGFSIGPLDPGETIITPPGGPPPPPPAPTIVTEDTVTGAERLSRQELTKIARVARKTQSPIDITDEAALTGYKSQIETDLAARVGSLTHEEAIEAFKQFGGIVSTGLARQLRVRIRETSTSVGQRLGTDFLLTFGLTGVLGEEEKASTEPSTAVPQPQNIGTAQ